MTEHVIDRREFLAGTGLALGGLALAGCGSGKNSAAPNKHPVKPPVHVAYGAAAPDLPSGAHGIPAAYFHYPANPKQFTKEKPGTGGTISFMLQADEVMKPKGANPWWHGLNAAMNADLKVGTTPSADYTQKFQVAIAGGNLPDIVQLVTVANMPQVLEKEFADLSDYVSGDKVKEYPGLASIPPEAWQIPMVNGRIWGIPQARPGAGTIASTRGDLLKELGIGSNSPEPNNGQEFFELCKELSDHKRGKYAIGEQPNTWILNAILEMMGAPNGWKVTGGKFTSVIESEEMKAALEQVTKLWKAGYVHPDSFTNPGENFTWWSGGITSIYFQNIAGWPTYAKSYPDWNIGVIALPKWEGGGLAPKALGVAGYGAYAALKKAKPGRIKELLRILDYFAAPFGTKEYLLMNYGVAGADYTMKGTDPVPTKSAVSEYPQGLLYCGSQQYVNLYVPGNTEAVKAEHAYLTKVLPTGVSNPTWGLYSETNATKGATAGTNVLNAQSDIIQGRRKLSEWDQIVKTWRQQAGDATRREYEKAYDDLKSGH